MGRVVLGGASENGREVPCFCLEGLCDRSANVSLESPERKPGIGGAAKDEACFFFLRCFSPLDVVGISSSSDNTCACSRDASRCLFTRKGRSGPREWFSRRWDDGRRGAVRVDSMLS